jgi:hypothetical protein
LYKYTLFINKDITFTITFYCSTLHSTQYTYSRCTRRASSIWAGPASSQAADQLVAFTVTGSGSRKEARASEPASQTRTCCPATRRADTWRSRGPKPPPVLPGVVVLGQQHHQCVRELLVLFVPCRLVAVLSAVQAGRDEHRRTSARHNTGRGGGLEEDHTGQGIAWAAADGCMVACTVRQAAGCTAHGLVDPLRAAVSFECGFWSFPCFLSSN